MSVENVTKHTSFILYFCENKYFIIGENKLEAKHGLDVIDSKYIWLIWKLKFSV